MPLTSALMGLAAVLVQWYSGESLDRNSRRKLLLRSVLIAAVGALSFYTLTTFVVKPLTSAAEHRGKRVHSLWDLPVRTLIHVPRAFRTSSASRT